MRKKGRTKAAATKTKLKETSVQEVRESLSNFVMVEFPSGKKRNVIKFRLREKLFLNCFQ